MIARSPDDMPVVRKLFLEYAGVLRHNLCFQGFTEELETLPGKYASPRGRVLLAKAPDDWAGCVAVRPFADDICEMKRLYVRAAYQQSGLGRRLAQEIIRAACEMGYARMRLDTLGSMTPARTLYESLEFQVIEPYYDNPLDNVVYYELSLKGGAED